MKTKRFCLYPCCLLLLLLTLAPAAAAQEGRDVAVFVDGLPVPFDVPPLIHQGRTLVPFRAIAETLNLAVSWDEHTRTVTTTGEGTVVQLQVDNPRAYINRLPVELDAPPLIDQGRVLIPLRFLSEAFNCRVEWDSTRREVRIFSPPQDMTVIGFYALGDSRTSSWTNLFGVPYPVAGRGNTDVVDEIAAGWYSLDAEGNLLTRSRTGWQRPEGWEKVLEAAGEYGLASEMVIHVTDGDGTLTALLGSEEAVFNAVINIMKEASLYGGINLDFEGLGYREEGEVLAATREAFNGFVRLLADQAHQAGLKLTLTLHPPNSVYRGYDYRALGEAADRIIIMAYDYGPKPEPEKLVVEAVEQALAQVPSEKLVLGISIPSENPESLVAKVGIAKRYRLSGIALWRLGLLSEEMWNTLRHVVTSGR